MPFLAGKTSGIRNIGQAYSEKKLATIDPKPYTRNPKPQALNPLYPIAPPSFAGT